MNIYCLGDSLTSGYPGYSPSFDGISSGSGNIESQYQFWLKRYIQIFIRNNLKSIKTELIKELTIINKGIPGEVSSELTKRMDKDLINNEPPADYCIIIIGTNDLLWGIKKEKVLNNIKKLHETCIKNNITSIGATIPPIRNESSQKHYRTQKRELNQNLKDYFSKRRIPFSDLHKGMMNEHKNLKKFYATTDGIHFTPEGYKKMGELIFVHAFREIIENEFN
ncbi:MAG: hypothetical protein BAJALOKI2v1_860004 [Promethearchaeota archaeon]|nr:MAG: hypothetical protein BAJALOKI2v1_860004 [Candidatus Lokiarchaeota archaeon]